MMNLHNRMKRGMIRKAVVGRVADERMRLSRIGERRERRPLPRSTRVRVRESYERKFLKDKQARMVELRRAVTEYLNAVELGAQRGGAIGNKFAGRAGLKLRQRATEAEILRHFADTTKSPIYQMADKIKRDAEKARGIISRLR